MAKFCKGWVADFSEGPFVIKRFGRDLSILCELHGEPRSLDDSVKKFVRGKGCSMVHYHVESAINVCDFLNKAVSNNEIVKDDTGKWVMQ